jgi:hypothetical protein
MLVIHFCFTAAFGVKSAFNIADAETPICPVLVVLLAKQLAQGFHNFFRQGQPDLAAWSYSCSVIDFSALSGTVHFPELFVVPPRRDERDSNLFSGSRPTLPMSYGTKTRRKPTLLLRLSGLSLLRFAERQFCAWLFQLPPRKTRFEPTITALIAS